MEESNNKPKGRRKPLVKKATAADGFIKADEVFGSRMAIPPEVKEELDAQGLVGRWLNAQEVHQNQGYHKKGWTVYRRKSDKINSEWSYGTDPSGVIRRGDSLLGVKTKEKVELHKQYLAQRAQKQSLKATDRSGAKELKKFAASAGLDTSIKGGDADD